MPGTAGAGWNSANLGQVASVYSSDGCAGFSSAQVRESDRGARRGRPEIDIVGEMRKSEKTQRILFCILLSYILLPPCR